jgi:hypothetical protein
MISSALLAVVFALILSGIGYWGRRNSANLVLRTLSPSAQRRKERSIRRGTVVCQLAGALFFVLAVFEFVSWARHG